MSVTMHARRTSTSSRPSALRLAAAGTLAALALAGCQAGVVDETTTPVAEPEPTTAEPVPQEPTTDSDQATSEEPTSEEPTTEDVDEPTEEDADAGAAASGEVPPPGSEFEVGDTVTTHVQTSGEPDDEFFGYATLATTVTSVEKGDPELFESAENAADFEGLTPWYVHVEHEWLTYEGQPNSNMIPRLGAQNEEGGEIGAVLNSTWSAGIPGCELQMPDEKAVGETAVDCHVFAVPDDAAVGAVVWNGDDYADGDGIASDNPYWDEPVLWLVP